MLQKAMPKQDKGVGIIPPPRRSLRRSLKGCRQCGGAANFCRSAAFPSLPSARLPHAGNPRWL